MTYHNHHINTADVTCHNTDRLTDSLQTGIIVTCCLTNNTTQVVCGGGRERERGVREARKRTERDREGERDKRGVKREVMYLP